MQAQSGKMASSSSIMMFSSQCCSHLQTKQANSHNLKETLSNSASTVPYQRGRTMKPVLGHHPVFCVKRRSQQTSRKRRATHLLLGSERTEKCNAGLQKSSGKRLLLHRNIYKHHHLLSHPFRLVAFLPIALSVELLRDWNPG